MIYILMKRVDNKMERKVKDVWFDNKGNPRITIEYIEEQEYKIEIPKKEEQNE